MKYRNMILKGVFIFLGVVCAVGLGRLVGGLTDVDVNEEGVQNALNFAISQHNLKTEDPFLRVKTGVVGVKKQIVSGIKYVITVNMTKTNCLKDAPNEQCDRRADFPPYLCTFSVWSRPWLSDMQLLEPRDC
ncbi:cystatin C (amyloid angiopathy and cerebral hemorrhage) [Hippocampus zosterae]|uniref:cystatin C (amyloid angiopathy and cerebral hemorrhage) n=1 Tax=Hippocampus zosterae TaxID=109293 RepID=UPI00223D52FF|nr:cystatin C (amyloid angiopathy and cerebral hemorrhage) [Hippocampus zosterae]